MTRESLLIAFGIILMASPFLGLPLSVLMWFYLAIGFLVALIGATLHLRRKRRHATHAASQTNLP
jgi:hypothetical protein